MTNPEDLRARANAADVAGDENLANTLREEADELEKSTPDGDTTPQ